MGQIEHFKVLGVFVLGGLCQGEICTRGKCPGGIGVYVHGGGGGLCPVTAWVLSYKGLLSCDYIALVIAQQIGHVLCH